MLTLKEIKCTNINGQDLYFLTPSQWEEAKNESGVGEVPLTSLLIEYITSNVLPYTSTYSELSWALGQADRKGFWLLYTILLIGGEYQRVQLERVTCPSCGIDVAIANPKLVDNYIGIPRDSDIFSLMRESNKFSKKGCPNCGSTLPRYAIWAVPEIK